MSSSENERSSPGPSATTSVTIFAGHFSQLMAAITASQSLVGMKLQQFREDIWQGQEEAATKALKWARYDKPYVSKKRGNEEQVTFNA